MHYGHALTTLSDLRRDGCQHDESTGPVSSFWLRRQAVWQRSTLCTGLGGRAPVTLGRARQHIKGRQRPCGACARYVCASTWGRASYAHGRGCGAAATRGRWAYVRIVTGIFLSVMGETSEREELRVRLRVLWRELGDAVEDIFRISGPHYKCLVCVPKCVSHLYSDVSTCCHHLLGLRNLRESSDDVNCSGALRLLSPLHLR